MFLLFNKKYLFTDLFTFLTVYEWNQNQQTSASNAKFEIRKTILL